jgi:cytochrome c biogenesis protein CcdA
MTATFLLALGTALWLGILTSISPCPLATNIAAISYISGKLGTPRSAALTGGLYAVGRALAYLALGFVIALGVLNVPGVSGFLQKYMNKALGPLLILVGMFLVDLLSIRTPNNSFGDRMKGTAERLGVWGGLLLGVLFALSFCPVSAALFFGSLLPLAVANRSMVLLPLLYGVGTALPVLLVSGALVTGGAAVGRLYAGLTRVERWSRPVTGILFIAIGIYLSLVYVYNVRIFG